MSKNLATESCVTLGHVYAYESMQHADVAANVAAYGRLYDAAAVMQDGSKDADGNNYETVQIGELCWTKTNLRTTKFRNGKAIPEDVNLMPFQSPSLYRMPADYVEWAPGYSDSTGYFFRLGMVTYDVVALAYDALKYGRSVRCLRDEPVSENQTFSDDTKFFGYFARRLRDSE